MKDSKVVFLYIKNRIHQGDNMAKSRLTWEIERAKKRLSRLEKERLRDPDGKIACIAEHYVSLRDEEIRMEKDFISLLMDVREMQSERKKDLTWQIARVKRQKNRIENSDLGSLKDLLVWALRALIVRLTKEREDLRK